MNRDQELEHDEDPIRDDESSNKSAAQRPLAPGLYLVATPIGNLEDITLRALRVLRSVDKIACEDTRQTQKLLNHFDIRTPTISYHKHNEAGRAIELATALKAGARIAVVSDAGTPGIADPGGQIAAAAIAAGVPVFPIPGANAAISALIASGLAGTALTGSDENAEQFTFHGFLPSKEGQRRTALETLRTLSSRAKAATRSQSRDLRFIYPKSSTKPRTAFWPRSPTSNPSSGRHSMWWSPAS